LLKQKTSILVIRNQTTKGLHSFRFSLGRECGQITLVQPQ